MTLQIGLVRAPSAGRHLKCNSRLSNLWLFWLPQMLQQVDTQSAHSCKLPTSSTNAAVGEYSKHTDTVCLCCFFFNLSFGRNRRTTNQLWLKHWSKQGCSVAAWRLKEQESCKRGKKTSALSKWLGNVKLWKPRGRNSSSSNLRLYAAVKRLWRNKGALWIRVRPTTLQVSTCLPSPSVHLLGKISLCPLLSCATSCSVRQDIVPHFKP